MMGKEKWRSYLDAQNTGKCENNGCLELLGMLTSKWTKSIRIKPGLILGLSTGAWHLEGQYNFVELKSTG